MIVISAPLPICYLLLIGEVELLSQLYGQVLIPKIVQQELSDNQAPTIGQNWIKNPPNWLRIETIQENNDEPALQYLDPGEKAAIILAKIQGANLVRIDDGLGRKIARSRGLKITGLLGVLNEAAQQNIVNFPDAIARLQPTTFFAPEDLIQTLLKRYQ
jgi:predicted nucleic acid-binding protein